MTTTTCLVYTPKVGPVVVGGGLVFVGKAVAGYTDA